ncbi:MAG: alpha/beta hydrolase [Bacteroidota bacterium]
MRTAVNTILLFSLISIFLASCNYRTDTGELNKLGHIGYDPRPVYDVAFFSESLQREMHINVVLPRGYEDSEMDYPVLYLCHGFTANYHEFVHVGVPEYLNRFDMIVVMVDAGNSSYVNWAESEDGRPLNFADHVTSDVINYVDDNYRTIADRKGRAINGISMGANGAITLGLSKPYLFCSIAGHSGGYSYDAAREELKKKDEEEHEEANAWREAMINDTTMYYRDIDIEGFSTMKDRTPRGKIFTSEEQIDRVDPYINVLKIPKDELPHIYIDVGTEDFLYEPTKKFMEFLLENRIPFVYSQSQGGHEEDYWGREVSVSMAVQHAIMLRNIWGKEFEIYNPYTSIFEQDEN